LEHRLDAVARFANPISRQDLIRRYANLHVPADAALSGELAMVPGVDFDRRRRAHLFKDVAVQTPLPEFPMPDSRAEALGLFYVLEGSTLGGRLILRSLAGRGVDDPALRFLDPYGADTGELWRSFLAVLARETADEASAELAEKGALRGFRHADHVLCGGLQ
jgi:heme oxygenase